MVDVAELAALRRHPDEKELRQLGARGYSVWFMPDSAASLELRSAIYKIGNKFGTPCFEPHITLMGAIEESEATMVQKMQELASITRSFEVSLSPPQDGENYFKTVYSNAVYSERLAVTNQFARLKFNKFGTPSYMPHLSFAYGNFTPLERSIIVRDFVSKEVSKRGFRVEHMELRKTEGMVESWKKVAEARLQSNQRIRSRA